MKKTYNRALLATVVVLSAFVGMMNQTILSVAQPAIIADFNVSVSSANWLSTVFALIGGILIPISAWLADHFDTKKLVSSALAIFLIGTTTAFLSGNFGILMAGRVIQAVGAGILSGLSMTILFSVFDKEESSKPTMLLGLVFGLSPAIGPTLGGYIVDTVNWHWIFGVTLPVIVLALVLSVFFMADVVPHKGTKLDPLSVLLSTLGFGGLLYGISQISSYGWVNGHSTPYVLGGLVLVIGWIWRQIAVSDPMLNLNIFKTRNFAATSVIGAIAQISMVAVEFILPLYLQTARGLSALDSGLTLLPGALVMFFLAPISGKFVEKNKGRQVVIFGITLMTISTLVLSFISLTTPIWVVVAIYALRNVGLTFALMPAGTIGIQSLPKDDVSHGSAGNNMVRQVGASIGTATLVSVMQSVTTNNMPSKTELVQNAGQYVTDAHSALIVGAQASLWLATAVGFVGILISLLITKKEK
ncbi:multidrug efflux MFS transporter [Fructobacillus sp. M2-14]|uniref:Multidrug efflux MFS transporter n=1 Tax=Fructobacillus broussonetiae TaxID=2713173 RepID=A0ABS5QYB8_9LACO|nr:MDR family MFS transporter [Fructobacillus broussonetiae]MBS9338194.1 multidrug efflux MFS transporter [Fructobacillus broussonetiae]